MTTPHTLRLQGDLTIYEAQELRNTLLEALKGIDALELSLADVSSFDSAAAQVLMAAKRDCDGSGKPFQLVDHSPAVQEVMEMLQLMRYFGEPVLPPATR